MIFGVDGMFSRDGIFSRNRDLEGRRMGCCGARGWKRWCFCLG